MARLIRPLVAVAFVTATFAFAAPSILAASPATTSAPVAQPDTWDLTDLYPTPEAWTAEYAKIKTAIGTLDRFKGTLGESAHDMFVALDEMSRVFKEAQRLSVYASLKADEDISIAANQERKQQAGALLTLYSEKTAWVSPELLTLGAGKVQAFIARDAELKRRFDFFVNDALRWAPHTLSVEAEGVLASTGDLRQQPTAIYQALASSDLPFPKVRLSDGTSAVIDQSTYVRYRRSDNRADRKAVFDAFYGAIKQYENSLGSALTTQVMANVFIAKARHFPSALAAAQFGDNMPEAVYRTLVAQANAGLPVLHRYLRLRKRLLGIKDDLRYYDGYPSMFPTRNLPHFTVDESKRITLVALQPYGEEYLRHLSRGFGAHWMNAYWQPHKAPGAYMNGSAYDVHPYLLLNHTEDYLGLSTLAHEWGHAVHTMLTREAQVFEKAGYSTFTAESASIGNEMLLNDYMVAHAATREQKLFYLGEGLESIRTIFFRQTMFGEFELAIHQELESGKPLSGSRMTEMYCNILKRYQGDAEGVMKIDPLYCVEWAYIPHFYYNFYVYQYATSMAGAAEFTDNIMKEGKPAAERFLALLRAGGSDYPYELYKRAGIDMATPAPYQALIARMSRIMDEIEALEKQPG